MKNIYILVQTHHGNSGLQPRGGDQPTRGAVRGEAPRASECGTTRGPLSHLPGSQHQRRTENWKKTLVQNLQEERNPDSSRALSSQRTGQARHLGSSGAGAPPPPQACSPAPRPAPCLPRNSVARNEKSRPLEEGTRIRLIPFSSFRYKLLKSISLAHKRRKIRIVGRLRLSLSNDVKVQR